MHWSDVIAEELIKRSPDKEEYVCAAGISPSGSIHIGNFRDIATSLFVVRALERRGKKAGLEVFMPPKRLCTDNAVMIGSAAFYSLMAGSVAQLDLNALPSLRMFEN